MWQECGLIDYWTQQGLAYGGEIEMSGGRSFLKEDPKARKYRDFFALQFSDSVGDISVLAKDLGAAIRTVRYYTGKDRVTLVSYSMGGVVSRRYLVDNPDSHGVQSLITLSTPHSGSYLANIANALCIGMRDCSETMAHKLRDWFGVVITSDAIEQLRISDRGFLADLNEAPHPVDVNYYSVIASIRSANPLWRLYDGDLVGSLESQNMANVAAMGNQHRMDSTMVYDANHFSVLEEHEKIYQLVKAMSYAKSI